MSTTSPRCPKCRSRSLMNDYDDTPDSRARVMVCLCCGKRTLIARLEGEALAKPGERSNSVRAHPHIAIPVG